MRNRADDLRTVILTAACALTATAVFAQTTPPPSIERVTFDQAIARALDHNPTVAEAATAILRADALLQQSRAVTRPTVSASATNTTIDAARGFSGLVTQPQNQTTIGVDVSMPVLAPSRWAAITQSRDQVDIAKLSSVDVRRQFAVAAAETYLTVIAEQRQVEVNERARDTAKAHLDYADRRLAGGAGTRLDELRAAQEVSSDEVRVENARLAVRRAQEALGVLLAAGGPVDVAGEPAFDMPAPADEAAWMSARTDVQVLMAQQHAAERVWRDSKKDIMPTATAAFDPQYVTPSSVFQPANTWKFTVSFSQPIFQGGVNKAVEAARKVTFDESTIALSAVEIQARSDVRLAQASVESNERALTSARVAAQQAAEVLTITNVAFQAGATTNLEVVDAERSLRDAETSAAVAEDAVRRSKLDLLVAMGRFPK